MTPNPRQTSFVASISLAHGTLHVIELTYAALLLRIGDEFGVDKLALGVVANAFALAFGIGALPSGWLVDRFGPRRVLRGCFLTAAAASLLVAASPSATVLGIFLAILGFCIGLYHPAALTLISLAAERRGIVLGYHGIAGNIGIAAAPALALVFATTVGWRWSYVFLALLALAMVFILQTLPLPDAKRSALRTGTAIVDRPASVPFLPLLLIYGAFLLNGFIYRGSLTFMPTLIEEEVHIHFLGINEEALAGSLTTLALLTGGAGQYLGGALSDRVRPEGLAIVIAVAVVPALLLMGSMGGLLLVFAAAFFVFFSFSGQPVYNVLLAEYAPGTALGRSFGISFFASFGLGSVAATFSGLFAETWGTASVFLALAAFATVTVALSFALLRLSVARPMVAEPVAID